MAAEEFDTVLAGGDPGPACHVALPFDPKAVFGRARAPVRVTIDGHPAFRTSVAVYGGVAMIGLRKDQQAGFGVAPGDRVHVRVERDDEPRTVEVPPELAEALAGDAGAAAAFERMSYTHRKEYARWVGEAKQERTRLTRAGKAVDMLREVAAGASPAAPR